MKDRLLKLLGIESGEESMIALLFTQSVFLGIFFGAFDISAHSFFLSIFDEKMMARGYVLSGLAGIVLTSIYTLLQTKIRFRNFATSNLVFVTLFTLLLWILLLINPEKWVIWLVFIMLGPLNILAMLGFWGTVSRLFTLRQGKRLFGLVDAGLIIGIIVSCYAIPVLLSVGFNAHNILLISAAGVLAGSIVQMIIGSRYTLEHGKTVEEPVQKGEKRSFLKVFGKDPYIRTMGAFIVLSVVTAFFVQYSFMAVTREQYPAEEDMARFLGLFTGSMMIFTLLIKLLVFSYLIKNYGLRTCLAISPILIAAFTILAALIGLIKGFTPAAGTGFMLFFMLLALSRLFSKALKDSIESPSFKVIYQTIDEKVRYEVQSGMDGTVNEIAALSSGLVLAGLGILSFVKLIHFSVVLIVIAVAWIIFALRLYTGYRNSIKKALEAGSPFERDNAVTTRRIESGKQFATSLRLREDYFNLITGRPDEEISRKSENYITLLLQMAEKEKDINLLPLLRKIASGVNFDKNLRDQAQRISESLELISDSLIQKDDRIISARKILSDSRQPQTTHILRLLRDNNLLSRKLAIFMIGKYRMSDMIPEVCESLNIRGLEHEASAVLRSFGSEADAELRRFYLLSTGSTNISKTILRLLERNCSQENKAFFFSRLWSSSRQVKETALTCLKKCGFTPSAEEKDKLHQLISDIIGIMVWNLCAKISLTRNNYKLLLESLENEISRWNNFLFNLLSVTYDPGSIARIRENLDSGTVESVNYALEMIDMVIDEAIKPKIIPLLDVIPDEEKVKQLFQFFPGEIPEYSALIDNIINRDYNLLGIWIRAVALRNLPRAEAETLVESLVSLLFSPEAILLEESAAALGRTDIKIFAEAAKRIPGRISPKLKHIAEGKFIDGETVFDRVKFLSDLLPGIYEENLIYLAGSMKFRNELSADSITHVGNVVVWEEGRVSIIQGAENTGIREHKPIKETALILPLSVVEEFCYHNPESSEKILDLIDRYDN